jgi:ATP-binding cassette, subfamily B, bacterial MsbA
VIIAEKIKTCNKQKFVIAYTQNYLLVFSAQRVIVDLRLEIQKHLMWLPLRFFAESKVGELVSRVTNDVTVIQGVITEAPVSFLRQVVTIAGGVTLMLILNWRLSLLIFIIIPPLTAIGLLFGQRLERLSTAVQDRLATATAVLEEAIPGIRVAKSFTEYGTHPELLACTGLYHCLRSLQFAE